MFKQSLKLLLCVPRSFLLGLLRAIFAHAIITEVWQAMETHAIESQKNLTSNLPKRLFPRILTLECCYV